MLKWTEIYMCSVAPRGPSSHDRKLHRNYTAGQAIKEEPPFSLAMTQTSDLARPT